MLKRAFPLFCITLFASAVAAHQGVQSPHVMARMTIMTDAKSAIEVLGDMAAGKSMFDATRASAARQALIESTKATPDLFKTQHTDPKTQALPLIWTQWADFTTRNKVALNAIQTLEINSLNNLQATLPAVGVSCLNCHQTYRRIKK